MAILAPRPFAHVLAWAMLIALLCQTSPAAEPVQPGYSIYNGSCISFEYPSDWALAEESGEDFEYHKSSNL